MIYVEKAKSIEELYDEVKEYELVLTADAALADALVKRLDTPKKGPFATTPARLALKPDTDSFREIFLKCADETQYSYKQITYALEKIYSCWKHSGNKETILETERYNVQLFEEIIDIIDCCNTPFHAVEDLKIEESVAVVNLYQFNELDRKILPEKFDEYSIFTDEKTELEEINIYESTLELVLSLVENIERVGAENVGIAVRPDSRYQSLLESRFKSRNIPYIRKNDISLNEELRAFISLLRVANSSRTLRVRDVKPLLDFLGYDVRTSNLNAFISTQEELEEFKEFLNVIEYLELGQVLEKFEELKGHELVHTRTLLDQLEILDNAANIENIEKLDYFVRNFDWELDNQKKGVLLADPCNTSTIDKPIVFFIGMSADWCERVPDDEWIDKEKIERRDLLDFQSLIQSGDHRYFLVEDKRMGDYVKPCFYIDELKGENVETFRELPNTLTSAESKVSERKFEKNNLDVGTIDLLSQTSLNSLALSPRLFYMSKLVSDAEEEQMRKGKLFHDFAELYFNMPYEVEANLEEIRNVFIEEMQELSDTVTMYKIRTEIKMGLKNLMQFLDEEGYSGKGYRRDGRDENFFASELGLELNPESTEMFFESSDVGIKGKIDLITSENRLIDFKSGRKKKVTDVVRNSRVQTFENARFPDFQALMYLAYHSRQVNGQIKFTYYHFLEGLAESFNGEEKERETTITYYPSSFEGKISELEVFESLIRGVKKSNYRRKTLEKLGLENYQEFFSNNNAPEVFEKNEFLKTEYAQDFIEYCISEVGDYKYVRKGAKSTLKKLVTYRNQHFFKDDVEKFEEFVSEKLEDIKEFEEKCYPIGTRDASELPMEDLIIE